MQMSLALCRNELMIESLYIAPLHGGDQHSVVDIEVVSGKGIVGDRNYGEKDWPGQNITFIGIEEILRFNRECSQNIATEQTRRNVITKGVELNTLIGKEFLIGKTVYKGVESCEPCSTLGKLLETDSISKQEVVKAFVGRGGLRADIIKGGKISVGMELQVR